MAMCFLSKRLLKGNYQKQTEIEFCQYVEDREIQLVMKMRQVEVSIQGLCLDNITNKSINLRKRISYQKCQHENLRYTLKYLQEKSKSINMVKIKKKLQKYKYGNSRKKSKKEVQGYRMEYARHVRYERCESGRCELLTNFFKLLDIERERLEKITKDIIYWRESNERLTNEIKKIKLKNREFSFQTQNSSRTKDINFRKKKLAVIMKRTELVKNIKENYDELLTLHSRLESLRLRIYPTLRFNKSHLT
ncbi:cilia- and flagella-associated protein 43-like isoform X1 [Vespula squamosa]|uniref:Cilia- and flagella-associated protein 43-like isoform X1 n=1 Tax=Vespula squamosa TaxID=30214 RepID=A0ABD2BXX8_VESSQ